MLRTAGFESAERPNGSNVVASGEGRDPEVLDWEWSRGRDLNPRPADYESAALPLSYPGILRVYGHPILHRFALTVPKASAWRPQLMSGGRDRQGCTR